MPGSPLTIVFSYASYRFTDSTVGVGGEEGLSWEIVSRLARRGHLCHVFSPRIELSRSYENIVPHPISGTDYSNESRRFARLFKVLLFQVRSRRSILRLIRSTHVDVVHHIVPAYPGFASSVAGVGVPFVYGPATIGDYRKRLRSGAKSSLPKRIYTLLKMSWWTRTIRLADRVMIEVDYAKKWMPRVEEIKFVRALKAVDLDIYRPEDKGQTRFVKRVLFLARVQRDKGADVLLQAVPIVVRSFTQVEFLFVGPVDSQEHFRSLVDTLGIANIVRFVGPVPHEKTPQYYREVDIYCFPSLHDNAPATLFEAMASGLPIIANDIMGVPEIIEDGVNGLLVPPSDSQALADAILRLLQSPDLMSMMGRENRRRCEERYGWDHYIDCIEETYLGAQR